MINNKLFVRDHSQRAFNFWWNKIAWRKHSIHFYIKSSENKLSLLWIKYWQIFLMERLHNRRTQCNLWETPDQTLFIIGNSVRILKMYFENNSLLMCVFYFQFRNFKIVYRRYAGLYFCICVDVNDNNLYYLEAIHNFVEVLNEYFHNVCELDLVFNFYKVYTVVDEMFLAGEIRETSQTKVLKQLLMLNSLE